MTGETMPCPECGGTGRIPVDPDPEADDYGDPLFDRERPGDWDQDHRSENP